MNNILAILAILAVATMIVWVPWLGDKIDALLRTTR